MDLLRANGTSEGTRTHTLAHKNAHISLFNGPDLERWNSGVSTGEQCTPAQAQLSATDGGDSEAGPYEHMHTDAHISREGGAQKRVRMVTLEFVRLVYVLGETEAEARSCLETAEKNSGGSHGNGAPTPRAEFINKFASEMFDNDLYVEMAADMLPFIYQAFSHTLFPLPVLVCALLHVRRRASRRLLMCLLLNVTCVEKVLLDTLAAAITHSRMCAKVWGGTASVGGRSSGANGPTSTADGASASGGTDSTRGSMTGNAPIVSVSSTDSLATDPKSGYAHSGAGSGAHINANSSPNPQTHTKGNSDSRGVSGSAGITRGSPNSFVHPSSSPRSSILSAGHSPRYGRTSPRNQTPKQGSTSAGNQSKPPIYNLYSSGSYLLIDRVVELCVLVCELFPQLRPEVCQLLAETDTYLWLGIYITTVLAPAVHTGKAHPHTSSSSRPRGQMGPDIGPQTHMNKAAQTRAGPDSIAATHSPTYTAHAPARTRGSVSEEGVGATANASASVSVSVGQGTGGVAGGQDADQANAEDVHLVQYIQTLLGNSETCAWLKTLVRLAMRHNAAVNSTTSNTSGLLSSDRKKGAGSGSDSDELSMKRAVFVIDPMRTRILEAMRTLVGQLRTKAVSASERTRQFVWGAELLKTVCGLIGLTGMRLPDREVRICFDLIGGASTAHTQAVYADTHGHADGQGFVFTFSNPDMNLGINEASALRNSGGPNTPRSAPETPTTAQSAKNRSAASANQITTTGTGAARAFSHLATMSLCFLLTCPGLLDHRISKPLVVKWAQTVLNGHGQVSPHTKNARTHTARTGQNGSTSGLQGSHHEAMLLVGTHFHNRQLTLIAELVRSLLDMHVQVY
ncbi:hypothetical protein SARC_02184, partial [Sphaeroforma arctica JP610]